MKHEYYGNNNKAEKLNCAIVILKTGDILHSECIIGDSYSIEEKIESLREYHTIISISYKTTESLSSMSDTNEVSVEVNENEEKTISETTLIPNKCTISAVLRYGPYIYSEFVSNSKETITERCKSWERNDHQIVRATVDIGNGPVIFDNYTDIYEHLNLHHEHNILSTVR